MGWPLLALILSVGILAGPFGAKAQAESPDAVVGVVGAPGDDASQDSKDSAETAEPEPETVIRFVDDDDGSTVDAASDDGAAEETDILTFGEAPQPPSPPSFVQRTFAKAWVHSQALIDTVFEGGGEHVLEWWHGAHLDLDHRHSQTLRFVLGARALWGMGIEDALRDEPFLIANGHRPKFATQLALRESYIQYLRQGLRLRAGAQIFVWGKNELGSPADQLNAMDLRMNPVGFILQGNLRELRVPTLALSAAYGLGRWRLEGVWAPFFERHRVHLRGWDLAVAPPGSSLASAMAGTMPLHPSVEDDLEAGLLGTQAPEPTPKDAIYALRLVGHLGGWDVGATGIYGWDRTPALWIDEDLRFLLLNAEAWGADPSLLVTDSELRGASNRVQQKNANGLALVDGRHHRSWQWALEAEGVMGPLVVRADLGYASHRVVYDEDFHFYLRPLWQLVLGAEYTHGETLFVNLSLNGQALLFPPSGVRLMGFDGARTAPMAFPSQGLLGRSHARQLLGALTVRYVWNEDWQAQGMAVYSLTGGDGMAALRVVWDHYAPHSFSLGAFMVEAPRGALSAGYRRSDAVVLGYEGKW